LPTRFHFASRLEYKYFVVLIFEST
jgi:hypothetical protein